ncbi:hypothetical protein BH11CYA1_BH11CYA1_05820 [soil metagenome]
MQPCVLLKISGRVQGVYYRHSTKLKAQELSLSGWVRNLADGSVEALVAGSEPDIELLIAWCKVGPPSAAVDNVEVKWLEQGHLSSGLRPEDEVNFSGKFEIR